MPARKTTTGPESKSTQAPVLFLHASGTHAADEEWTRAMERLGARLFSHAPLPGAEQTEHDLESFGALMRELSAKAPGRPVLLVRAGMALRTGQLQGLVSLLESGHAPAALTVTSNASPECNPFAGIETDADPGFEALSDAVAVMARPVIHPWPWWPDHLLALAPAAVKRLGDNDILLSNARQRLGDGLGIAEWIFVADGRATKFAAARLEPHESARPGAWGTLQERLCDWLDAGAQPYLPAHDEHRPITLHVTHSWGGGVGLWTKSFIDADTSTNHLQLRSEGTQSGRGNGQRLALYAGNELNAPIAAWWLQPPIQSVEIHSPQYAEILQDVIARFGVARVMVSSLVGHSLDALKSGLPTIQILHDHFPLWPLLSVHPARHLAGGEPDLAQALQDQAGKLEFSDHDPAAWRAIRDAYIDALQDHDVKMAAPSRSVIEISRQLDARLDDRDIRLIPHGVAVSRRAEPVRPRARDDGRLRLLVPGRIQPGKGKELLLAALPELTRHAQVYLLGSGQNGEDFFGLPGVTVILQYQHDELAGLLEDIGPHVAALLSVVPETFSYALTELRQAGIPVIATRRGSFTERIRHGENGWLIEPEATDLVAAVRHFHEDPKRLEKFRKLQGPNENPGPDEMAAAYNALCPPADVGGLAPEYGLSLTEAQVESAASQVVSGERRSRRAESARKTAERELARRTRWAEDADRALKRIERRNTEIEAELEERKRWALQANAEAEAARQAAEAARQQVAALQRQLEEQSARLHQARNDLQVSLLEKAELAAERQRLQDLQDQILSSLSWRMTRPLRAGKRAMRNAWQARIYNPARWPLLISKLARYLVTLGPGGTIRRLQRPAQSDQSAATARDGKSKPGAEGHRAPATKPAALKQKGKPTPLKFETVESPAASIVIPAFNQWEYTRRCLESLARERTQHRFEIIVVDDASSDQTQQAMEQLEGVTYLRNAENRGFIESCNRGAAEARGEFLVLLNNDTEVTKGWLDRLLETFERVPGAGLVGARLVYPDGSLQECGGLVFSDGSGWNYGKHDDPDKPEYQYLREVDYCSGACIMLRTRQFREMEGFDPHYAPAYYEDTDLAFRLRERGLKVLVQPECVVIHHEGVTSGTDTSSGAKRFQDVNREKFLQRWAEQLQRQPPPVTGPEDLAGIRRARDFHNRGRVLVMDATTPEPDQDSGSMRLTNIMRCFRDLGYGVTFVADNRMYAGRYTRALQRAGVEVQYLPWLDPMKSLFAERGGEFDFVFISRHYIAVNYLTLLKQYCPRAPFIFDTVDLHYLREQRLAELEDSATLRQVARQTRRSELGVIAGADVTVVVSPAEVEVLAQDAPGAKVHVLSNIHDVPGCRTPFAQRKDLFFVGGYQHPPNIDAANWFVHEIWPRVRERLTEARFHLIGSKAPDEIRNLAGNGVEFHGFVEDLEPWLDGCRLAVAPLRYGAGVKGKVNMSMSYGQPVVATRVAVEGMYAENGREVLIADSAESFADETVRLYSDESLWNEISSAAVKNVEKHFSLDAARRSLAKLLDSLAEPG